MGVLPPSPPLRHFFQCSSYEVLSHTRAHVVFAHQHAAVRRRVLARERHEPPVTPSRACRRRRKPAVLPPTGRRGSAPHPPDGWHRLPSYCHVRPYLALDYYLLLILSCPLGSAALWGWKPVRGRGSCRRGSRRGRLPAALPPQHLAYAAYIFI